MAINHVDHPVGTTPPFHPMVGFPVRYDLGIRASLLYCLDIERKKHIPGRRRSDIRSHPEWPFLTVERIPYGFHVVRLREDELSPVSSAFLLKVRIVLGPFHVDLIRYNLVALFMLLLL